MKGREENEQKLKNKIELMLSSKPSVLNDYYLSMSRKTYATKISYINHIIEFLNYYQEKFNKDMNVIETYKNIKYSNLNAYIDYLFEKGNENSSVASKLYAIKNLFAFMVKDGLIEFNPCVNVEIPKIDKEMDIVSLNKKEIKIVLNNIDNGIGNSRSIGKQRAWKNRDKAIFLLGVSNGLRVTAMTEINMEDIDFENNIITVVEKGNKTRTCFIPDSTMNVIKLWIEDRKILIDDYYCEALFISNRRDRMTRKSVEDLIKKYTENINKHITPHKLRSTCATTLYQKTGDIYLTAGVIGHKNIQNTRKYAKISTDQQIKAASIMNDIIS